MQFWCLGIFILKKKLLFLIGKTKIRICNYMIIIIIMITIGFLTFPFGRACCETITKNNSYLSRTIIRWFRETSKSDAFGYLVHSKLVGFNGNAERVKMENLIFFSVSVVHTRRYCTSELSSISRRILFSCF